VSCGRPAPSSPAGGPKFGKTSPEFLGFRMESRAFGQKTTLSAANKSRSVIPPGKSIGGPPLTQTLPCKTKRPANGDARKL